MIPHHDGSELYVSNPAPGLGDTVSVFVRVPRGTGVSRVHLRRSADGEPVFASAVVDRRDSTGDTWWRAELPVRNPVTRYRFLLGTTAGVRWLTGQGLTTHDVPDHSDFQLVAHPAAPAWARDAVVYQIFPDRFARSTAALDHVAALGAEVAAGLLLTLPGTPMIFAGDELGLTGLHHETGRAPMSWDRPDTWDTATLARYRQLIRLRHATVALRRGGLRWVHAAGDTLAFLRESAAETVLVLARRATGEPVRLTGLPPDRRLESLYGGGEPLYTGSDGSTAIDAYGPAFAVWRVDN
jgi:hypothetical protein